MFQITTFQHDAVRFRGFGVIAHQTPKIDKSAVGISFVDLLFSACPDSNLLSDSELGI